MTKRDAGGSGQMLLNFLVTHTGHHASQLSYQIAALITRVAALSLSVACHVRAVMGCNDVLSPFFIWPLTIVITALNLLSRFRHSHSHSLTL